jgi:YVTN family beta-propeller protein
VSALGANAAAQGAATLVVLNKSDNTVSFVDPQTLKVLGTAPTGNGPHEAAASADGKRIYVANYGDQKPGSSLSIIDAGERKELTRFELPGLVRPHGIVEAGGNIYFTAEGSAAVARFNPTRNTVDWVMGTGEPVTHMLVITPDQRKVYTANIAGGTVTMLQLPPYQGPPRAKQIKVGQGPEGIDISPDGKELWVAHRNDGTVSIIDTGSDQIAHTFEVGKFPIRVKFTRDGSRVLVSNAEGNDLAVVDAKTRQVVKRIPTGEVPVGILMDPNGKRAFVAATAADKVIVVDLEKLEVTGTIQAGKTPDGMAWAGAK